jgi:cysteinyl-tRNA synthetase
MVLRMYNSKSRDKEDFVPLEEGVVRMYVCGPTVYDDCHVGHARSYVAFDVIRRYLEYKGYRVTYVQNFTDVDDKIINRAREKGMTPLALSEHFIQEYYKDMDRLSIRRATIHPKASELVPDMINFIEGLSRKGHAYVSNGSVYFEVDTAREIFGQLRHQSLEDMKDGARIEVDPEKRSPKDFALWKRAKDGEISWDSPWGPGRPGWHIECSTMSQKYLGTTLDIHGGGMDLIFPHHESEILQSESNTGQTFVRYWLHNGFVEIDHEKMSKSLGNFFTVKDILKKFDPMVLRFFLVYTHYRSPIDFSDAALKEAGASYERLRSLHASLTSAVGVLEPGVIPDFGPPAEDAVQAAFSVKKAFLDAMDDDFNTRVAVSQLFRIDDDVRGRRNAGRLGKGEAYLFLSVLDELSAIVGLEYPPEEEREVGSELAGSLIELLIRLRAEARKKKDYATADTIRNELNAMGIVIEDEGGKTLWKLSKDA